MFLSHSSDLCSSIGVRQHSRNKRAVDYEAEDEASADMIGENLSYEPWTYGDVDVVDQQWVEDRRRVTQ